ncbi:MAG: hypothetical protein ACLPWF_27080 [Bryobacteraceae bacterium]|jgi:hypothetical protein
MSRQTGYIGLDWPLHDPRVDRDGVVEEILAGEARAREEAHDRETDEMIAMGWGTTDRARIPSDWRERRGPDNETRRARKAATMRRIRDMRKRIRTGT